MTSSIHAAVLLMTLAAIPWAAAQTPSEKADQVLQEVMEADGLPSISVAVSKSGELVYARALGSADLENHVAATVDTRYSIGSVAKSITAVAALQLSERGKLDLDAPVERYCPAFPPKGRPISVGQLLAHTGGIRHYDYRRFEEDFLNRRRFESIEEALDKFKDDPLVAEPGTEYRYSSWGYVLVGCAIEGASGRTYSEVLQSDLAEPAGLVHTRLDVVAQIIPDRARGYSKTDSGTLQNAGLFDPSDRYPAGGVLSTPGDLVRFGDSLAEGRLLGPEARKRMWSSTSLASGDSTGHGLGWDLSEDGTSVFHGGTTVGATSFLLIRPTERLVVALSVNLSLWERDRLELAERVAALFGEAGSDQTVFEDRELN